MSSARDGRKFEGFSPLVTMSRQASASKQQRQEWTPWLFPSEREQRRPYTEQSEWGRNLRARRQDDNYDIFGNRRTAPVERPPQSSYSTSYGQHYNQVNGSK